MIKSRLALPVLVALAAAPTLAGCGGSSSSGDPATLAPPDTSVFVEATMPSGSAKENVDELARKIAGVENLGEFLIEKAEESAGDSGHPLDYEKEIAPWLGQDAGIFLTGYDGNDFSGTGVAVEVTNSDEARKFIDERVKEGAEGDVEQGSYKGVDYQLNDSDESVTGVLGDFAVYTKSLKTFKEMVDASQGESLADVDRYTSIVSAAPDESLAHAYIDVGRLIEEGGNGVDANTQSFLDAIGLEVEEASALASLVPGTDQVELDVASSFGEAQATSPASDLLGTMPAGSVAALASSEFGKAVGKAIDKIDAQGIPGQVPPHQLKSALQRFGIDLDRITGSLQDIAAFAEGTDKGSLAGAVVLTTDDAAEAANTVAKVGLLLRANHTPGVSAVTGKASGFSIHNESLGPKPLVVATAGKRIAIGYGLPAALTGLASESGATLSGEAAYKEAVGALGGAGISGFVDGPAAVALAGSLVEGEDRAKFAEVKPYLSNIGYVAIGSQAEGELNVARLIVGLTN
jgi:hypothetical protein